MTKEKLRTVNIKGKEYVEVAERVRYFNDAYPKGCINTEIVSHEGGVILVKTTVIPDIDCQIRKFTGYAQEEKGKGMVNALSYVENCETSAVGRALGFLGIGVETSIRSADEMRNISLQNPKPSVKEPDLLPEPSVDKNPDKNSGKKPEKEPEKKPSPEPLTTPETKPTKVLSMNDRFLNARKALGDEDYYYILKRHGVENARDFKSKEKALEALVALEDVSRITEVFDEDNVGFGKPQI